MDEEHKPEDHEEVKKEEEAKEPDTVSGSIPNSEPSSELNQEAPEEPKTISVKKDDMWKYATFVLLALVIIGGFVVFSGNGGTGNAIQQPTGAGQQPPVVKASIDDDAVLGDKNAPVTIIEFSDYQCPFCGRFWSDTLPLIKSEYIETGKVKLVYRDFPLTSIHPMAQSAAEATECVRDQGGDDAFWEYHDKIFANQVSLSEANLIGWANEMSYDIQGCLSSNKFASEVQKDTVDAQAAGGRGTPFFVINGNPVSGAQPFSAFQQVIEAELA